MFVCIFFLCQKLEIHQVPILVVFFVLPLVSLANSDASWFLLFVGLPSSGLKHNFSTYQIILPAIWHPMIGLQSLTCGVFLVVAMYAQIDMRRMVTQVTRARTIEISIIRQCLHFATRSSYMTPIRAKLSALLFRDPPHGCLHAFMGDVKQNARQKK